MLADSVTEFTDGRNYREYLRGIQAGCFRLTRLVDDFIRVMELRSGEAQANYLSRAKPMADLSTLLKDVIMAHQGSTNEVAYEITYDVPEKLPVIFGDSVTLTNIFERLLNNAIKFTDPTHTEPNHITVTVTVQGKNIQIVIEDEGMGFPARMKSLPKTPKPQFQYWKVRFDREFY